MRKKRAGIWAAGIAAAGAGALALLLLRLPERVGPLEAAATCRSNLRTIGLALQMYAQDNGGRLPPAPVGMDEDAWLIALREYLVPQDLRAVLYCPLDVRKGGRTSYHYLPSVGGRDLGGMSSDDAAKKVMLGEKRPFHGGGLLRGVCYANGDARLVSVMLGPGRRIAGD